ERRCAVALEQLPVVTGRQTGVDTRAAVLQRRRRDAGVFERAPARLQQQALLRIHALRFARRDAEETGVEAVDRADEATPAGGHLAGAVRVGIVVRVDVEA